jgi:hypothetical protein
MPPSTESDRGLLTSHSSPALYSTLLGTQSLESTSYAKRIIHIEERGGERLVFHIAEAVDCT